VDEREDLFHYLRAGLMELDHYNRGEMKMKQWKIAVCVIAFAMSGCASSLMKPAENQKMAVPSAQTSRVIFMRPSSMGGAIQAALYDVTSGEPKFFGISSTSTKVAYDTKPGTHRFMVVSEAADFMEAKLEGGKTYYALVTPRMGAWKARFSLWPVKADEKAEYSTKSKDFATWLERGKLVNNTPEGEAWAQANAASVKEKYAENLVVWKQKTPTDLELRTLNPQDGMVGQ
jgi:hypothetical protein